MKPDLEVIEMDFTSAWLNLYRVRTKIGWSIHSLLMAKSMVRGGLNYYEDTQCEEGGALLPVRYVFSDSQITQIKEFCSE